MDYPKEHYEKYQEEAEAALRQQLVHILQHDDANVVLDFSFAFREDREAWKALISAGGIPGWVLRRKGIIRSNSEDYLRATDTYMATLGKIIAKAQITNGGPVILVQPENEYTTWPNVSESEFPTTMNQEVMAYAEKQLRDAGVVVPTVVNDNKNLGYFAPGTGLGETDLYGIDAYPMRYDCETITFKR